ncbi:DNA gyrase subunit A [Yersinia ruckeri]|uniref:DNA gyrase subunit A n=1 Tax=Yersinia ruckeri TaxID=29486 RepID=UPI002238B5CF|nr:DNA gyrase subunit A [Yersinia ruckeri]MCW6598726.1 hypothetical protein [Yersinia ruckeri]
MSNLFSAREKDNFTEKDFGEEISESMAEYSLYTAYDRSVPCIIDGLKPVQRRTLYASWQFPIPMRASGKTHKCAKLVGAVMGDYHPHGDAGIYEALVKMISPVVSRYSLFSNEQGNFGDPAMGDGAAASRYTETKLSVYGELFLDLLDSISYAPTYDGSKQEPVFLCPAFPSFLMNESVGIGSGISGSVPGHNLVDICEATELLLNNPTCSDDELIAAIKGPEFPTGGNIMNNEMNRASLKKIYTQGRGTLYFEAKWHFEKSDDPAWKFRLVVDEFCPGMTIYSFTEGYLKELCSRGTIHIRDDSAGSEAVNISIYANSNNVFVNDVLPQLRGFFRAYRMTAVDLIPVTDQETGEITHEERLITATLRYAIGRWYRFRTEALKTHFNLAVWRLQQDLWKAELRKRLIEEPGLIDMIRNCNTQDELDNVLYTVMGLTEEQATYVMRIQLGTLIRLNADALQKDIDKINADIRQYNYDTDNLMDYILKELREIRVKYGDPRRTSLFLDQDIPEKEVVNYLITLKETDYRLNVNDSWPANGVGLSRTVNALIASDRMVIATYDGNMVEKQAEDLIGTDWYGAGATVGDDDIMVIVDDQNQVDYRWVPNPLTRKLRLTRNDVNLKHACGINAKDAGVVIRLNGKAWSFLSRSNLEGYATDKVRKFWSYNQDKNTYATQVFRVGELDDIVDSNGNPISFNRDNDDLIQDGQVFVVADYNFVYLKSGRLSYMDRQKVFSRWDSIQDIIPLGTKPLNS